ncbi:MAG: trimethylamine methyltransferase family protein, partial [Desulfobacterales bacterium]
MKPKFDNGKSRGPGFSLSALTDDELHAIHLATLEVLHQTGLFVETREALDVFDGAGAEIDPKNKIVKIPPYLVDDAIRSAPSKIILAGRDPKNDKILEADRVHFTNFSEGVQVIDPYTGERRTPTKADLANAAKVVDYLSDIDVCEKAVGACDAPPETIPLHNAEAMLANTTKHCCVGPGDGFLLKKLVEMAAAVVGGLKKLEERP